jgi:hypothetical protein
MIKHHNSLLKYLSFVIIFGIFNGCSSSNKEDEQIYQTLYQSLKDNQSKFVFKLDGKEFYNTESVFNGHLEIVHNSFTINFSDQFDSNVMIHFGGYEWYKEHPVVVPIKLDNSYSSNVMIGRIKDKEKQLGDGYLMSEGTITIKTLTKQKIVIEIAGRAKKYPKVDAADPSFEVKGTVVCKNPNIDFLSIDEKAAFYGQ